MGKLLSPILYSTGKTLMIQCPGCNQLHPVAIDPSAHPSGQAWAWNGSEDKPTFSPSLLCNQSHPAARCHSFIVDGNIQYLDDCFHELAGKTVPLDPIPAWWYSDEDDLNASN